MGKTKKDKQAQKGLLRIICFRLIFFFAQVVKIYNAFFILIYTYNVEGSKAYIGITL